LALIALFLYSKPLEVISERPELPQVLLLEVPADLQCMMAQVRLKALAVMEGRHLDLQEATSQTLFLALGVAAVGGL
jgi:hypothetical protein